MKKNTIKGIKKFSNIKNSSLDLTTKELSHVKDLSKDLEIAQMKLEKGFFPAFPVTTKQKLVFSFLRSDFEGLKDNTLMFIKSDGTILLIPNMKTGYYSYFVKSNNGKEQALSHISDNKKLVFAGKQVWMLKEGEFECYPHETQQDSKKVQSALYNIDSGNKELQKAILGENEKKRQFVITLIIIFAILGVILVVMYPDLLSGILKAKASAPVQQAVQKTSTFVAQNLTK